MLTPRNGTLLVGALSALSAVAYGQQPISPPSTTTTTATVSRPAASPDLNTDTNAQPDMTGSAGHPGTDVRIRPGVGSLAAAMANFSVRTGLEIRPNKNAQVVVSSVRPNTTGARAGIEKGDIITKVDAADVTTISDFQKLITRNPSKAAFLLSLKRGDQTYRTPLGRQLTLLGMTMFPDAADRPVVVAVDSSSPAGYAGFQVGDMITGYNHQVSGTMDRMVDFGIPFIRGVAEGQGIPFQVVRDGKPLTLSVTRPADADLPMLTPEQERHLRRLANGEDRVRPERPRTVKSITTTQTIGGIPAGAMVQPALPANPYGGPPVVANGGVGVIGDGYGGLPPVAPATGSQNVNAAVAVLHAAPGRMTPPPATPPTEAAAPGPDPTAVGFVQIQANIALNGNPQATGPTAPAANPVAANTTAQTIVPVGNNPRTTTVTNYPPSPDNPAPVTTSTTTGNNPNVPDNGAATQSFVTARIRGLKAGKYTLVVGQYGTCGNSAGFAPGPGAVTLGTITASGGQGVLQNVTVNFGPQSFVGRTVSLVPAGATSAGGTNAIACGVFRGAGPNGPINGTSGPGPAVGPPAAATDPVTGAPVAPPSVTPPGGLPRPLFP